MLLWLYVRRVAGDQRLTEPSFRFVGTNRFRRWASTLERRANLCTNIKARFYAYAEDEIQVLRLRR